MPLNIEPLEPRSVHSSAAELGCGALAIFAAIDFYSTLVILVGGFDGGDRSPDAIWLIWLVFATTSAARTIVGCDRAACGGLPVFA